MKEEQLIEWAIALAVFIGVVILTLFVVVVIIASYQHFESKPKKRKHENKK